MRRCTIAPLLAVLLAVRGAAAVAGPAAALLSTGDGIWFWRTPRPAGTILLSIDDCATWRRS
jgi:hypothetical protein